MRYLVVGLGNIGRKRQALLGDRCVATADPYNSDAQYASPLDCPPRSYEAAILATPNQTKVDLLEWLLDHGKHVLVEKPLLFADRAQAERLGRLAAMRKVTWYTSYNHRYETLIQRLADPLVAERIGALYHARLVYGNGTVANVAGTWRDQGLGVLEDLTSHLLDLAGHLLGARGQTFQPWTLQHHEAASFDHCILGSADGRLVLESSYLSWRNTFSIDIFGSRGSMHLSGLEKWGPSELVVRERVYPSGVPRERVETAPGGADPTWQRDLEHFERQCAAVAPASIDNDWWITETLLSAVGA